MWVIAVHVAGLFSPSIYSERSWKNMWTQDARDTWYARATALEKVCSSKALFLWNAFQVCNTLSSWCPKTCKFVAHVTDMRLYRQQCWHIMGSKSSTAWAPFIRFPSNDSLKYLFDVMYLHASVKKISIKMFKSMLQYCCTQFCTFKTPLKCGHATAV